jgi:hypothetical protein
MKESISKCVQPYTMTSSVRVEALIDAVRYVVTEEIAGTLVECGVWQGGSIMAMALTLLELGTTREIFLYDTFRGMTAPTSVDISVRGTVAADRYRAMVRADKSSSWCYADRDTVLQNVVSTGYPPHLIHLVQGPVEVTLPSNAPERIALLRLDTDWHDSTRHELVHLFPRVSQFGVLICDDYGHWFGARKAVDEYFGKGISDLESISKSARILIKRSHPWIHLRA